MKYLYTVEELKDCFGREDNVAIYGAGNWGRRLADYVIWGNLQNKLIGIIISEKKDGDSDQYRDIPIYEADKFLAHEKCIVVIAVSWRYQEEIQQVVQQHGNICYVLSQDLFFILAEKMDVRRSIPYKGIDFLCPGFTKCGTTSLHEALITMKDIYLSQKKESQFLDWYSKVDNPKDVLVENYFNVIKEGQTVGMIEPTFFARAKEVYEIFGSNVKLFFLVRNPVESTFSRFKMMLRGTVMAEALYQKYDQFSLKMFDEYIEQNDGRSLVYSKYIDWINEFKRYYPEDQIKIVYFEELIKKTKVVIDDLLKFIGSKCSYESNRLPFMNEGNYVMADLESYRIGRQYQDLSLEYLHCSKNDIEAKDKCYSDRIKAYHKLGKAEKIYNVQILDEQRKKLEIYFYESVRALEDCFHKDLSKLWF